MIPRFRLMVMLASLPMLACTTLPTPSQHWYSFPKDAYTDEGIQPHISIGSVRARTDFPSLDPDNDDFDHLCKNYYNKSVEDLVKMAKDKGADAVIEVRSVVFLENGKKEAYKTAECADDGEEGQSLAEGLAVKWAPLENTAAENALAESPPAVNPQTADKPRPTSATPPAATPPAASPPPAAAAPAPVARPHPPIGAKAAAALLATEEETYNSTEDDAKRFEMLEGMARNAFDSGQMTKAREYAKALVDLAPKHKTDWAYGNAIHRGNLILGRLALRNGDTVKAKTHLLLAGRTPGSPQLDSFGPNMSLAKELLEHGERKVVLDYLDLCSKFWRDEFARKQLAEWKTQIEAGQNPDFWAHLRD